LTTRAGADALDREGTRLLKLLGYDTSGVHSNIGLEQEFFLVPRDAYTRRIDLQLCPRIRAGSMKICCREERVVVARDPVLDSRTSDEREPRYKS